MSAPLELVLSRLDDPKRNGDGWKARCPAHDDSAPSLSIKQGDKGVVLKCFAHCETAAVVAAIGLKMSDLFDPGIKNEGRAPRPSLQDLAADKRLPLSFLKELGLYDLANGGVGIPYRDANKALHATKSRVALKAKDGSYWEKGKKLFAYGADRLARARELKRLVIVEGESDCWTLWHEGFPALGLPGADTVGKTLDPQYFEGLDRIDVIREPDTGGRSFAQAVALLAAGRVPVHVVDLIGAKDPNALYQQNPEGFKVAFQKALKDAPLWEPEAATVPAEPRADADEEETETNVAQVPEPMNTLAFAGLAGEIVDLILPHTEASEEGLLFTTLAMFGNAIGRGATFSVGAAQHTTNLFVAMVGRSSKGRKGTSLEEVQRAFRHADPLYVRDHIASGLSSGEGLIYAVRDKLEKQEPVKEKGKHTGEYQTVTVDEGVFDKRILDIEPEFASVLRVLTRDGNTLSAILRQAWDSGNLRTLTRNSPLRATNAHISMLAHVTKDELLKCLDSVEYANGFANRFLWVYVQRSKLLPDGGNIPYEALEALGERLAEAINFGSDAGQPTRDAEARDLWHAVYPQLAAEKSGAAGAATSRAEAQVVRLSLIYALLDRSMCIRRSHLESALEVWRYCEDSATWIFGQSTGNAFADALLTALRAAGEGLTRTDLMHHFQRHKTSAEIQAALCGLAEQGRVRMERRATSGRPKEVWRAL